MRIDDRLPDGVLLRRAAKGDEEAFATLYRRHQAVLYRFAMRMTGSAWGAEEIVQEVFLLLVRDPNKYESERGTLAAFLFGVARNRILKHLERSPREVALEGPGEEGTLSSALQDHRTPAAWVEHRERMERVRAAVLELPPEFREAVALCDLEEMSYEDAAERMDCPIGTVRSRLHRGRALLLAKLEMLRARPRRANAVR